MHDVTRILGAIERGDPVAAAELLPVVYDELRRLAAQRMSRESPGHTLQPTALVHEAYLRLTASPGGDSWENRAHFFAAAAETMRRILIDLARARRGPKRGGGRVRVPLEDAQVSVDPVPDHVLELDEALARFEAIEPEKARLVQLRYFGGLTQGEAAQILGISKATADRHWAFARAWLFEALGER